MEVISLVRFATKTFHLLGWLANQASTTCESDQQKIPVGGTVKYLLTLLMSRARRRAPHYFKRGMLSVLSGATFDLADRSVAAVVSPFRTTK